MQQFSGVFNRNDLNHLFAHSGQSLRSITQNRNYIVTTWCQDITSKNGPLLCTSKLKLAQNRGMPRVRMSEVFKKEVVTFFVNTDVRRIQEKVMFSWSLSIVYVWTTKTNWIIIRSFFSKKYKKNSVKIIR